ncbi:hypothetical protein POI8812_02181 [Pontivivens insulae]|uniref:Uncharacterized protein n=1 Tax=Pontivivens insulae TaxID=1639689 RepID=A0A2R8ACQ4_9RHOB|nr:hypothetical protein DFR53_1128 [Pontivivens insulae]SPF29860.1 hypothetical protein POI8812_02181 [Pontivivens insulae]
MEPYIYYALIVAALVVGYAIGRKSSQGEDK